jgi:hypothetical protein
MSRFKKSKNLRSFVITSLLLLCACGGTHANPHSGNTTSPAHPDAGGPIYPNPVYPPQPAPLPTPVHPTPTPQPSFNPELQPLRFAFEIRGTRGGASGTYSTPQHQTFNGIYTDSTLRVTVTANPFGSILNSSGGKSGHSYYSDCFSFYVGLNHLSPQLVTVKAGSTDGSGTCSNGMGVASPTIDFSSQLAHGDTNPISITLSRAQSNTCGPTSTYGNLICFLQDLYSTYVATGTVTVSVDAMH